MLRAVCLFNILQEFREFRALNKMPAAVNLNLRRIKLFGYKMELFLWDVGVIVAENECNVLLVGFDLLPLPGFFKVAALFFQFITQVGIGGRDENRTLNRVFFGIA